MKVVFLSNFFNHHQKPLSDELSKRVEYTFISTTEMPEERKRLGYRSNDESAYVLHYGDAPERAEACLAEADVIVTGSAPADVVRRCIKRNQLVLRYSERPLKHGPEYRKFLYRLIKWNWQNPPGKPIYMLCASAYTAGDYARFGLFRNRTYQWGYFPPTVIYPSSAELLKKKITNRILWCGRFLNWKHPDDAIRVAETLKKEGREFSLDLIGTGELEEQLRQMTRELNLDDRVRFLGSMSPEQVRSHMEGSGIFLFTSDSQEGWGAVLNEAMNSGCAVVASHAIGAVPYLIQDGENGMLYQSGNVEMLTDQVRTLLDAPEKQKALGYAAYKTIAQSWNAKTAAERLLELAESLLEGRDAGPFHEAGPCSRAEVLREDWYRG